MQLTSELREQISKRLYKLYGSSAHEITHTIEQRINEHIASNSASQEKVREPYSHRDVFLITYGDSVKKEGDYPLESLSRFIDKELSDLINAVHILPFFPYSSDDGFSVIDYKKVRPDLGDWTLIKSLSKNYKVMADLVINHVSSKSNWFKNFIENRSPGKDYFHVLPADTDVSMVTRPRSTPLLTPVQTKSGEKHVWTTFSPDQVDVDFSNPDVLIEYLDILLFYMSKGVKVIRLDAVAFLWKKTGSKSIHLEETHEVVRLIRDIASFVSPESIIITETNVPHKENISYFGDGDEAHMVYNFSLPPLMLHAILTGNATYLTQWSKTLSVPPKGCTYFNFTASHDGIGVRPLEGLVPKEEFEKVVSGVIKRGGEVSYKQNPNGIESPYELNITYFDAFSDLGKTDREAHIKRFMCSQALMMGFRGVPAIYIHSFTATFNYHKGVRDSGVKRAINRMKWDYDEITDLLDDKESVSRKVLDEWRKLLNVRRNEPSFDPQGGKKVLSSPPEVFAMWRCSPDGKNRILIAGNVSSKSVSWRAPFRWNKATELISKEPLAANDTLHLSPWQVMWVKY